MRIAPIAGIVGLALGYGIACLLPVVGGPTELTAAVLMALAAGVAIVLLVAITVEPALKAENRADAGFYGFTLGLGALTAILGTKLWEII